MPVYGQLVVGPPGSGKTTYCRGIHEFLSTIASRDVAIINLDPANDALPYQPAVDIAHLVDLATVQQRVGLGPNGGLLYCLDYLAENLDWLDAQLQPLLQRNVYLLFDLPGQVELFTLQRSLTRVVQHLTTTLDIRLTCVHCVDAHLCSDAPKYLAALLLSLNVMLHLELPHVNVLTKVDMLPAYGELPFDLEYYCEAQELDYLAASIGGTDTPFSRRFAKLASGLCELVEGFGLLGFVPLAIEDGAAVARVLRAVDRANGYALTSRGAREPHEQQEPDAAGWRLLRERCQGGGMELDGDVVERP